VEKYQLFVDDPVSLGYLHLEEVHDWSARVFWVSLFLAERQDLLSSTIQIQDHHPASVCVQTTGSRRDGVEQIASRKLSVM